MNELFNNENTLIFPSIKNRDVEFSNSVHSSPMHDPESLLNNSVQLFIYTVRLCPIGLVSKTVRRFLRFKSFFSKSKNVFEPLHKFSQTLTQPGVATAAVFRQMKRASCWRRLCVRMLEWLWSQACSRMWSSGSSVTSDTTLLTSSLTLTLTPHSDPTLHSKLYSPIMVETQNTTVLNREIKYNS